MLIFGEQIVAVQENALIHRRSTRKYFPNTGNFIPQNLQLTLEGSEKIIVCVCVKKERERKKCISKESM